KDVPVCVPLSLPPELANVGRIGLRPPKGPPLVGQLTAPGLLHDHVKPAAENHVRCDLHFVIPRLAVGETAKWQVVALKTANDPNEFVWRDTKGEHADLLYAGRPVMRYMYRAYDKSSPQARDKTYKVFHHLFDPAGKRLVTNGGQTDENITNPKKLLYPHHRG